MYVMPVASVRLILQGTVMTMDPALPFGEAVGIRDGRIAAVGAGEEVRAALGDEVEVVRLDGAVLPGFIDAPHHYCLAPVDAGGPALPPPPRSPIAALLAPGER